MMKILLEMDVKKILLRLKRAKEKNENITE